MALRPPPTKVGSNYDMSRMGLSSGSPRGGLSEVKPKIGASKSGLFLHGAQPAPDPQVGLSALDNRLTPQTGAARMRGG